MNTEPVPTDQGVAVMAQSLYLANLLLAPGLAFLLLLWLYRRHIHRASTLVRCHLRQTLAGSLWAGLLLLLVNAAIVMAGGYHNAETWLYLLLYFTVCHSTLVLLGMVGLSKALAGKPFRFPLIGARCDG